MRAGSVLDDGKSPLYKYWPYLEVALHDFGGRCGSAAVNAPSNHLLPLATAGVIGNLAPPEIWHPHAIFPRKSSTPSGKLEPPPDCRIFGTPRQKS